MCNLVEVVFGSDWHICQEASEPCVWITEVDNDDCGVMREQRSFCFCLFIAIDHLKDTVSSLHGSSFLGLTVILS